MPHEIKELRISNDAMGDPKELRHRTPMKAICSLNGYKTPIRCAICAGR